MNQEQSPHDSVLDCLHEYITSTGTCSECGATYEGWNQKDRGCSDKTSKTVSKNILSDLHNYTFPDDIKYEANEIFQAIGMPTKRSNERLKMLFYCVYTAYRQKGRAVNPQVLGKTMNLSSGDINRALTAFSEVQTGYRPVIKRASAVEALPELCSSLGLDDIISEVTEIAREVIVKCPTLREEFPHKVAAGILSYYMEYSGIKISSDLFKEKVDFSDVTIKDIHQRITRIHNE